MCGYIVNVYMYCYITETKLTYLKDIQINDCDKKI